MGIPHNQQTNVTADGSQTAATGTFDLSSLVEGRRYAKVVVTVDGGGSAAFSLKKGLASGRSVEADSVAATAGHIFTIDDGPWAVLTVDWSGNSGADTVTCDVDALTGYPHG
jgi:hypothetical protein